MSVLRRVWFLLRRGQLERQLREEIDWHLQQRARAHVEEGLDEAAARQAALRDFGNVTLAREESRDWWGFAWLDLLQQDVHLAARALARQPLLTAIAVLSLGASMAACCAVFSLANTILLVALPVPDPSRLAVLRWISGPTVPYELLDGWSTGTDRENSSTSFSSDAFMSARDGAKGRANVFGFADLYAVSVSAGGQPEVATGQLVSGNYFAALGLRPSAGRFITPADDRMDASESVAVISHAYWMRRFGGRPDIVGATIRVNQVPTVVIGVAPPLFNGTRQVGETTDVSIPMMLRERFIRRAGIGPGQTAEDELRPLDPRYWWVNIMARLAPGAGVADVQRAIEQSIRPAVVAARGKSAEREPFRVELRPGARGMPEMREDLVQPLAIMAAIVAVVIVIACANLATLLLARGVARDREVAVRHALGASRGRLMRTLMAESLIIGLLGGLLGLVGARWVAYGLLPALRLEATGLDMHTSARLLAFAFVTSVVTSLLFGLVPAWRGTDVRSARAIREGTGSVVSRVPRLRTARAILTLQIAVSIVVLLAAGLLLNTMRNLQRVEPGFDAGNVLLFRVDPTLNGYDQERIRRVYAELLSRLGALPGVGAASFSQHALLSRSSSISTLSTIDGVKPASRLMVNRLVVDRQFLAAMRIPLLAGSTFGPALAESSVRPVVINRTFAEQAFHAPAPIGHRFRFSDRPDRPAYEVVGVAADVCVASVRQPVPPTVYFSYQQETTNQVNFALRVAAAPMSIVPSVRRVVAEVDPDLPIDRVRTQEDQIAQGIDRERLFATLASALGGLALCLACIGVYGVMAYAVSRRTMEIGVRLALGARPDRILRMVIGEAGRVIALGVVLGLAGALAATRYLASLLFGLTPTDPLTQAFAVGLLVAVAVVAAFLPALRAARTDPLVALRHE